MDSQPWRERLVKHLREQRLPPAYIDRLVEELAEHVFDSQLEETSMEAQQALDRLGTTEQLAAVAGHEYRRRSFAGRHPWLTFVCGPIAIVPMLFVTLILGFMAVGWLLIGAEWLLAAVIGLKLGTSDMAHLPLSDADAKNEWWCILGFDLYVRFVPFVLAAWVFCRLARRTELRTWGYAACAIVGIIAGFIVTRSVPSVGDKPGLWMIGLGFQPELRQLMQLTVPLAVGCGLLMRLSQCSVPRSTTIASST
jgi:hypothetical protein